MTYRQTQEESDQEKIFLDDCGYVLDIPESQWPKSEDEWNILYAQELSLIKEIKSKLATHIMDLDVDKVVELIESKNIEYLVFAWVDIHRKIRSIMRKQKKIIIIVPTSQLILRASDMLKLD